MSCLDNCMQIRAKSLHVILTLVLWVLCHGTIDHSHKISQRIIKLNVYISTHAKLAYQ